MLTLNNVRGVVHETHFLMKTLLGAFNPISSGTLAKLITRSADHVSMSVHGQFNPQQPKVFGIKFGSREIKKIFSIELRNFKLWKMPKLLNFRFPEG